LDSSYLPGLKTLLFSLRADLTGRNFDLIIFTNDERVANDAFVRSIAQKLIVLDDDQIGRLRGVKSDQVEPEMRVPGFGKYTFLKCFCFDDLGYDFHLYIDTDFISMDGNFRLAELIGPYDFAAAPTTGPLALKVPRRQEVRNYSESQRSLAFQRILKLASTDYGIDRSINGGIWLARRRLLGPKSVQDFIDLLTTKSFAWEQSALREFAEARAATSFHSLPIWYNFQEFAAHVVGIDRFSELRPRIKLFHFNGPKKPWSIGRGRNWVSDLWWKTYDEAMDWKP
jgi:hypothetical protein